LNFRPHVNVVFDFISVRYTITDLQAPDVMSAWKVPRNCIQINNSTINPCIL